MNMNIMKQTVNLGAELGAGMPFNFLNPPFEPIEFAQSLVKTMYNAGGICLAAPQVGVDVQAFAMRGAPENFVCFNPRIVFKSDEQIVLEETSLSYPGLIVKIKRPKTIRVRFMTPNGETRTDVFEGLTARTFQHCMDILSGEPFYKKANFFHREQALRKWKKKYKGLHSKTFVV